MKQFYKYFVKKQLILISIGHLKFWRPFAYILPFQSWNQVHDFCYCYFSDTIRSWDLELSKCLNFTSFFYKFHDEIEEYFDFSSSYICITTQILFLFVLPQVTETLRLQKLKRLPQSTKLTLKQNLNLISTFVFWIGLYHLIQTLELFFFHFHIYC